MTSQMVYSVVLIVIKLKYTASCASFHKRHRRCQLKFAIVPDAVLNLKAGVWVHSEPQGIQRTQGDQCRCMG